MGNIMDEVIEKTIIDWYSNGCTLNTLIRYLNSVSIFGEVDKNKAIEIINGIITSYNDDVENELKEAEKNTSNETIYNEVTEEKNERITFEKAVEKTCVFCNKRFYTVIKDTNYCSDICYKKSKRKSKTVYVKNERVMRFCLFCGKGFHTNISKKIYCSLECRTKAYRKSKTPERTYIHVGRKDADEVYKESFETPLIGEDSLFCDTKFLEQLFGKKIKKTDECK